MSARRMAKLCIAVVVSGVVLAPVLGWALSRAGLATARVTLENNGGVVGNTVLMGSAQALAATALAWMLAMLQQHQIVGRRLLHLCCLAPMIAPPFTMAAALIVLFGHNGVLGRWLPPWLPDIYGAEGLVIAGTLSMLPYAYLMLLAAYRQLDQRLIDQAADLGLGGWTTLRVAVLPRLLPALVATALMVFVEAITELANPLVIGGGFQVLASRIHLAVTAENDLAAAAMLAVLLVVPSFALLGVARALGGDLMARVRVLSLGRGPTLRPPTGSVRCAQGVAWLVVGLMVSLLVAVVFGALSQAVGVNHSLTSHHLREVLVGRHSEPLAFSLVFALVALPCTAVAALGCAMASLGRRGAAAVRAVLVPLGAVPGLVLGLSLFILLADTRAIDPLVWGAVWAILAVHLLRGVPMTAEPLTTALQHGSWAVRDTARMLGFGWWRQWRLVSWPAVSGLFAVVMVGAFVRALTSVSSVILLTNSHIPLLPVRAMIDLDAGQVSSACASSVVLGAIAAAAILVCRVGWGRAEARRTDTPRAVASRPARRVLAHES